MTNSFFSTAGAPAPGPPNDDAPSSSLRRGRGSFTAPFPGPTAPHGTAHLRPPPAAAPLPSPAEETIFGPGRERGPALSQPVSPRYGGRAQREEEPPPPPARRRCNRSREGAAQPPPPAEPVGQLTRALPRTQLSVSSARASEDFSPVSSHLAAGPSHEAALRGCAPAAALRRRLRSGQP